MRKWMALAAVAVVVAGLGGYFGSGARADMRAQSCDDWVSQTYDRVNDARTLLYPADRPDAFQGSAVEAAEELYFIFEEQRDSNPPDGARQLDGDLLEALTVGAEALASGGADAATQVVFAKSIIYNADARLVALDSTC